MAHMKDGGGLHIIFAIFLGLMVTAFVGVGVYTFYPSPQTPLSRQLQELNRQERSVRNSRAADQLTPADRARIQEIDDQISRLQDAVNSAREYWGRRTSIILIIFATLVMAISLVRADRLPVISNGLLLGGVFTMIYGVGWIIATDTSVTRFSVMTVSLVITLALGYVRFVRNPGPATPQAGATAISGEGVTALERRVRNLEQRLDQAATALHRESRLVD